MKRIFSLFIVIAAFLFSCNNSSKQKSPLSKSKASNIVDPDTVQIDRVANRDMMIILSLLPDTIAKSFKWDRRQRFRMRETVEKGGYLVDSNQLFKSDYIFKNNHLDFNTPKGKFLLTTYQIRDGHYVILTVETANAIQTVHAYEIYRSSSIDLGLTELLGKYSLMFMNDPSNQSCLGLLYDRNPIFDFIPGEDDRLKIKITNYDEDNAKGCLKGNLLTLKFNRIKMPFEMESITWED